MSQFISNLPVGSKVKDITWTWEHKTGNGYTGSGETKPVTWLVVAKNHSGYPESSITLITEELIAKHIYDNSTDKGSDYGSNHYGNSGSPNATKGVRKFLNGSSYIGGDTNSYPITLYDSMSEGFRSAILITNVENKPYNSDNIYYTEDKLFLPSQTEMIESSENTRIIGMKLEYFTSNTLRVAKLGENAFSYIMRSPQHSNSDLMCTVSNTGSISGAYAFHSESIRPLCNLKSDIMVSDTPDTDGAYTIVPPPLSPLNPSNLTIVKQVNGFKLDWVDNSDNETGFKIRKKVSDGAWTFLIETTNSTYTDIFTYLGSTTYEYSVCATNSGSDSDSIVVSIYTPPDKPLNFTHTTTNYNVNYLWNSVSGATGYKLYSGVTLIAEVFTNSYAEVRVSEVSKDVHVIAYNASGDSLPSNTIEVLTIPNVPSNLILNRLANGFELSWNDNSSLETKYRIEKRINTGSWGLVVETTSSTYTDTFAYLGSTTYEYRVFAVNTIGYSLSINASKLTPPDSPTNLAYTTTNYNINYSWNSVIGALGYTVYSGATPIKHTTDTSFTEINSSEISKEVSVAAYNDSGESIKSNTINVLTIPNKPTNITINELENGFTLNWNDNSNIETYYKVYKKVNNGTWQFINDVNNITYTNSFAKQPNTLYEYQVCAYNDTGYSDYIITTPILTLPNPPTNFNYAISNYDITYLWDKIDGLGYRLYSGATLIADVDTNMYTENNTSEKSKNVSILAYNTRGDSALTEPLQVYTIPNQPTNLVLTQETNGIQLNWTDNSNLETGFKIERRILGETWEDLTETTNTTYIDVFSYNYNTIYEYRISAYNDKGYSATTSNTILTTPSKPTNLRYTALGYNIEYMWDNIPNINGYRLYQESGTLIADVTTNFYAEVNASEIYKNVYVIAYNNSGDSISSDIALIRTIPNNPTDLILTQSSNGFKLDWTDNSIREVGFRIERRKEKGNWVVISETTETTFTDVFDLETNILYEYQVCAYNSMGDSAYTTWGIATVDSVVVSAELKDSDNQIIYTWDESIGVTGYRLYLTDADENTTMHELTVRSYTYSINGDTKQTAYVIAYIQNEYGEFISTVSNTVEVISSPKDIVSDITYSIDRDIDNAITINLSFKDNSIIEDGFKVRYKVDDSIYKYLDITSTSISTTGKSYNTSFVLDLELITEKVVLEIAQYNEIAIGQYSSPITILKPSDIFQIAYRQDLGGAYLGWYGVDNATDYEIVYKINNGQEQSIIVNFSEVDGNVYRKLILLDGLSTIDCIVYPRFNGYRGIPTIPLQTSYSTYEGLQIPSNFSVGWYDVGVARYNWNKTNQGDMGYIFSYNINHGEAIDINIDTTHGLNFYDVFPSVNFDTVYGKVKAYSLVDESSYTHEIEITYILVDNPSPSKFIKYYDDNFVLTLSWGNVEYLDHFELHYFLDDEEHIVDLMDTQFKIPYEYRDIDKISAYVIAYYAGGAYSEPSKTIEFSPTLKLNDNELLIKNFDFNDEHIESSHITRNVISKVAVSATSFYKDLINSISKVATSIVEYAVSNYGKLLSITYTKTSKSNDLDATITNKTKTEYGVNSSYTTANVLGEGKVETKSYDKDVLSGRTRIESTIKNRNVQTKFPNAQAITSKNLIQSAYRYVTSYFTRFRYDSEPIQYVITGINVLTIPIETEIHKIRVCTIGDSITAGHPGYWAENEVNNKPNSGSGRITSQYQYWLQKRLGDEFEVINNGYGSDTTQRMLDRFDRDVIALNPQYVIIQGGTNDLYWAMAENKDNEEYLQWKMEQAMNNTIIMIDKAIENNIIPIVGALIPRTTAQGIYNAALREFNSTLLNYCSGRDNVYFADFYNAGKENIPPTPLEEPTHIGNLNPLYDGDSKFDEFGNLIRRGSGVHPSDEGYKFMAEAVPLSIFKSMSAELKMYIDDKCTIEEDLITTGDLKSVYNLDLLNVNRGRVKSTTRYLKNIGVKPLLYALYPVAEEGLELKLSVNDTEYKDYVCGQLDPQGIAKIDITLDIPRLGDTPEVKLDLATRSFKTKS